MRFFFDSYVFPRIPHALQPLVEPERDAVHIADKFAAATRDDNWLHALGAEDGWIAVTGDLRIMRRPVERAAWQEAHVRLFVVPPSVQDLRSIDQAIWFLRLFDRVVARAAGMNPSIALLIPRSGSRFKAVR